MLTKCIYFTKVIHSQLQITVDSSKSPLPMIDINQWFPSHNCLVNCPDGDQSQEERIKGAKQGIEDMTSYKGRKMKA